MQQVGPRDACRAAGGLGREFVEDALEMGLHTIAFQHILQARVQPQAAEGAAGGAGEDQGADFLAVDAGQHHVLHIRRAGRDDLRAQGADTDKGAG